MSHQPRIFISSAQKELAAERRALADFIQGDPLLRRYFDVFLFEDLPATDRRANDVYLDEVDRCAVYMGLFGNDYGNEDAADLSPMGLDQRQADAIGHIRARGRIGNVEYQKLLFVSRPTASRDLEQLRSLGVLEKVGRTGKGTYYVLDRKGLKGLANGSNGSNGSRGPRTGREKTDTETAVG